MKSTVFLGAAAACVLLAATPAFAGEQPPPPPNAPPPSETAPPDNYYNTNTGGPWAGWYIGAHIGGDVNGDDLSFRDFSVQQNQTFSQRDDGGRWLGGVQGGYGWWQGNLYLGVEGDIGFPERSDYLASVRGRAGFGSDRWLVYGTAGWAFTQKDERFVVTSADDGSEGFTRDRDDTGLVLGAGLEYALNRNLALGVEGLWYDFGGDRSDLTTSWGDGFAVRDDSNFGIVRARLTWYLNN